MSIVHCSCGKKYDDKYLFKHLNSKHHQKFVEQSWNEDDTIKKLYNFNKKNNFS